jgi:hypothetical protein
MWPKLKQASLPNLEDLETRNSGRSRPALHNLIASSKMSEALRNTGPNQQSSQPPPGVLPEQRKLSSTSTPACRGGGRGRAEAGS